jgi:beta-glucanase (GH16 family)
MPSHRRWMILLSIALIGGLAIFGNGRIVAQGDRLDLDLYVLTFSDEFDDLSVSAAGTHTRWTAHTSYNGDFGDARFADPTADFPFSIADGILRIEARKGADETWRSGLLSSMGPTGSGFAQKFGYFEIRAKLPDGPGTWPAFWLLGVDRTARFAELDVFEFYGHATDQFHSAIHVWNAGKEEVGRGNIHKVPARSLVDQFNTYGVAVRPDWTIFYLNRQEVWRIKSESEFAQPMYILIDLALGSGWPIDKTPNPSFMYVDYVRAYAVKQ